MPHTTPNWNNTGNAPGFDAQAIFDNAPVGIFICTPEGRYIWVNPATAGMLGYENPREVIESITDVAAQVYFDPADRAEFVRLMEEHGQVVHSECRMRRRDGTVFWVSRHARAIKDPEGRIVAYMGFNTDVTERKRTEDALRESELRFQALHNASFGGIVIHDKGIILECNQGLSDITGYTYEELIGMDGLLLIAEKSREAVMKNILAGYEKPYEAFGLRKNGEEFPLRLEARVVPYRGKQVRTVEFRDITERKAMEAQLMQAQKLESVGRLAGGVAHDFNNMLGVILGHVEMAFLQMDASHPLYADLAEIQKAARRSAALTRQLLGFARKQTITPKVLDFNATIEGMLTMLRRVLGEDIELSWQPGNRLYPVKADPSQIDQILVNLCVNARDAIDGVGRVTIETANRVFDAARCARHPSCVPGAYVMLAVSDSGCGMDEATLDQIFDPFFTTKEVGKGTGLGLSTVYGIVRQNRGFIHAESQPGQGSTFKIYLPQYKLEDVGPAPDDAPQTVLHGWETILLVEDEPTLLRMMTLMLERLGYTVQPAGRPEQALRLAQTHADPIHLLITDVVMPEMNGRELSEKLMASHPAMRCLFISGHAADAIGRHGVLGEGMHFIQKPFSMKELSAKVRQALK